MIYKYNNTQSNKMINHSIHEQNIYDKIIVLLTSKLLYTNKLVAGEEEERRTDSSTRLAPCANLPAIHCWHASGGPNPKRLM
jgi:hypothetical protein